MLFLNQFPPGALALATLAAIAAPAHGDDFSTVPESIEVRQTYFPAAGSLDYEHAYALVAADRVKRDDPLSASLSPPMRTYFGRIVKDAPFRSNGSGVVRQRLLFSMVPIGREMRAQLNYRMPAGGGATFALSLSARTNPSNLIDAMVETRFAVRYLKAF